MSKKLSKAEIQASINESIKFDKWIISLKKNRVTEIKELLATDTNNVTLKTELANLEAVIVKLEARLERFIANSPELLGA